MLSGDDEVLILNTVVCMYCFSTVYLLFVF